MSSKPEKDKVKQLQDKCQAVLNSLLRDEDNKYCVDCDSKGPRWASWNIGVFLCIRCAGIHRNLGVHISKVKSVNLDSWTPEQVVSLQQMGNSRARAVYEANLPDNFRRPQNDSSLETFIRAKYEHKKYIAREWVPPELPKVNWEKEIDEEIEKQKRKRKMTVEKKSFTNVEVPQLPKPKNPSPKPGRVVSKCSPVLTASVKKDNDLLGLQSSEDNFGGFLSAPAQEDKKAEVSESIKSEEESFFNQTMPPEKEKVKLTKDSILALYGNTAVNNFGQFQNSVNQVPYQAVAPAFPPQQAQMPSSYPTQNFSMQNGLNQYPHMQIPQQVLVQSQMQPMPMVNQYFVANNSHPNPNISFQNNPQFPANNPYGQFGQQMQPAVPNQGQQNPFFSNPPSLHQQFNSISLGSQGGNTTAPTLASNIFQ